VDRELFVFNLLRRTCFSDIFSFCTWRYRYHNWVSLVCYSQYVILVSFAGVFLP